MSRSALARSVAILLEAERDESAAIVEMAISLRVCDVDISGTEPRYRPETDEELIEVGGRWNRRSKRWSDDATAVLPIRIPRGSEQEVAARWCAEWLRRSGMGRRGPHWDDFRRVWTLLLEGGRAGGKSYLAIVVLVVFSVMVPGALVWAVSPTQEETDELEQAIVGLVPRRWYKARGAGAGKVLQFKFANGSRILCLSGHKPRSLKRGKVDLVLYNEGQNMSRAGWVQLRGAVARTGGLVIIAANPPDAEIGRWIEEVHERGRAGKIKAEVFKMTAASQPFVEAKSLQDMQDENDEPTFRREVLGEFVPIGDIVFHAWSDSESVLDVPGHWVDVTQEVTKRHFGRPFDYVIGMDFQKTPHMVAAPMKLFRDPADEIDPKAIDANVIAVIVDEVIVEDADEHDLVDALEGRRLEVMEGRVELRPPVTPGGPMVIVRVAGEGYDPDRCVVVMDASGFGQDGAHSGQGRGGKASGRTSEVWLRQDGWRWLYTPSKYSRANPIITERCKVANSRFKAANQRRRAFVLRVCAQIPRALRSWEIRNGAPYKLSPFAHICDAVTYPMYRFWERDRGDVPPGKASFFRERNRRAQMRY